MNNNDLQCMNDHNYHSKKRWRFNLTIKQEKYIAIAVWILGVACVIALVSLMWSKGYSIAIH